MVTVRVAWRNILAHDASRPATLGHGLVVLPWRVNGVWERVEEALRPMVREQEGRHTQRGLIGQFGTNHGKRGPRGYDA